MSKEFICSAVIVNELGDQLMVRRARDPYEGQWSYISGIGASRKGLLPDEAVRDEVRYDIGADFEGEVAFEYDTEFQGEEIKVYVSLGKITIEAIRLNPEAATEVGWFSEQEIENIKDQLAFNDEMIFDQIRLRIGEPKT